MGIEFWDRWCKDWPSASLQSLCPCSLHPCRSGASKRDLEQQETIPLQFRLPLHDSSHP